MEPVTFINALSRICKHEKKFGVYVSFCSSDYEELIKAAPWAADFGRFAQLIADGQGIVLFDTEQEMDTIQQ